MKGEDNELSKIVKINCCHVLFFSLLEDPKRVRKETLKMSYSLHPLVRFQCSSSAVKLNVQVPFVDGTDKENIK